MKNFGYLFTFLIFSVFVTSLATAKNKGYFYDKDGVIKKGTTIMITEYTPELEGVFEVQTEIDYGNSSYYTRMGDLIAASKKIKNGSFKRKPRSLQGKKFELTSDLVIYTYPIHID